ncbi:MAG: response regulator transcription factor [Anaerolineaceae bacterium]|nr:response regulator transcription factor [Anaerolineaceae bacterium]
MVNKHTLKNHPISAKVLVVEGKRVEHESFIDGLRKKGFTVISATNGTNALEKINEAVPDVVVIDAPSLRTNGKRICQAMRKAVSKQAIILVVDGNQPVPQQIETNEILTLPFTAQKLANRIRTLLPESGRNIVSAGPIKLYLDHNLVRCLNKRTVLTPRLVIILSLLIEHRGEVIDRKVLYKKAWETEYTGDTRSLDVHISWLRRAIESDPRNPRFVKTIRGVGYRLDA